MKKSIIISALLMFLSAFSAGAYSGVSKLFVEENGELFNAISVSTRYELINNYGRSDKTEIYNDLRTEVPQY